MPKKVKKESLVTVISTLSDDIIEDRHYIVNHQPECISFWSLTSKLSLMKESELIGLIRLGIDFTTEMKCGGTCTTTVTYTSPRTRTTNSTKRTVKSPICEDKCLVHIKRIL